MKIGIDFGNVICGGGGEDTSFFSDNYLRTPELAGAWTSIAALRNAGHELHIVSKCYPTVEAKTVKWVDVHGFYLNFKQHRVHIVRKRELKAPMCKALELDIFIDDRQDIINSLHGVVEHPILFTSWEQTNAELEEIFASQG